MSAAPVPCICEEGDCETSLDCTAARKDDRILNTYWKEIIRGSVVSCSCARAGGVATCRVLEWDPEAAGSMGACHGFLVAVGKAVLLQFPFCKM